MADSNDFLNQKAEKINEDEALKQAEEQLKTLKEAKESSVAEAKDDKETKKEQNIKKYFEYNSETVL